MNWRRLAAFAALIGLSVLGLAGVAPPTGAVVEGGDMAYTTSADFAKGTLVNLNSDEKADQLQLNKQTSTFPFIWIALSARGTVAKIDTTDGTVLGEYSTTSDGDSSHNPSRTTVGLDGSLWAGNRNQSSVIHVGLKELNQCIDRNENGVIDTSTGYGDVKEWPGGTSGASSDVADAEDECILHYVDTVGGDARHVSVNPDGDIWVGSTSTDFQLLDGTTAEIIRPARDLPCGGYGGLVDENGVVWSAVSGSQLLRWDPNAPDEADVNPRCLTIQNYGLAIDPSGNVWVSQLGAGMVTKVAPDGTVLGTFNTGLSGTQGLASDRNGHIWLSSSLFCSGDSCPVSHLTNDGELVGLVPNPTGAGSTGVAIDSNGKIWTANINDSTATRIDPEAGEFSSTEGLEDVPIGTVDLTVDLPGASPYNYSDMTGAQLLTSTAVQGSWSVVQDGGSDNFHWHTISFNNEPEGFIPPGASISLTVEARAANSVAGLGGQEFQSVSNCVEITGLRGRFVEVRIVLRPNDAGESPVLSDVWIRGGPGVPPGECVEPAGPGDKPEKANGYIVFTGDGGVHTRGDISFVGAAGGGSVRAAAVTSPTGRTLNAPIVGGAVTPDGKGYYLVASDGGVFTFGNAVFRGSTGAMKLNQPIVGMAADPDGSGYWLVASDGGVFSFAAAFAGSTGAMRLNQPIVGIAADPDGTGYWLAASDGGVFSFAASFAGSLGGTRLNAPITGITADPDGTGYWMTAPDGGVFAFGAAFYGAVVGLIANAPVVGIAAP